MWIPPLFPLVVKESDFSQDPIQVSCKKKKKNSFRSPIPAVHWTPTKSKHFRLSCVFFSRRAFPWTVNNHFQCRYCERVNEGLLSDRRLSKAKKALSNRRRLPCLFASHKPSYFIRYSPRLRCIIIFLDSEQYQFQTNFHQTPKILNYGSARNKTKDRVGEWRKWGTKGMSATLMGAVLRKGTKNTLLWRCPRSQWIPPLFLY